MATTPRANGEPLISWRGVTRHIEQPVPLALLHPADLTIRAGEQVAITGPSGAGKSTVLYLLGLLDRPSGGEYLFEGRDVSNSSERDRAGIRSARIGFVFQSFHLLAERTAAENVELGMVYGSVPRSERRQRALDALERVGLTDRRDTRCAVLSGGESQRVAIARAVSHNPRLILADEPTGNLDTATSEKIMSVFDGLTDPDVAQVIVTHSKQVAEACGRTIEITDGFLDQGVRRDR